jgi:hypothetical protein
MSTTILVLRLSGTMCPPITTYAQSGVVEQAPFEFFGARLEAFLETRRERAALHKLLFQSGRQFITLGPDGKLTRFTIEET